MPKPISLSRPTVVLGNRNGRGRFFGAICCWLLFSTASSAQLSFLAATQFPASDTLDPQRDSSADARACIDGLIWAKGEFQVGCLPPKKDRGDALVAFPSALPSGNEQNDRVTMEWYVARDAKQAVIKAPAVVVVHESGGGMQVGRLIAQGLNRKGLHAFMIHLPFYGERKGMSKRTSGVDFVLAVRQAVADVRRARDAVAAIPLVDSKNISLQGTSLGSFVSTASASLDRGYNRVFLLLSGADLYGIVQNGVKDAAKLREELERAGLTGEKLKFVINQIEPTRIAHRLDAKTTWLYTGKFDRVVPPANARILADAAKLENEHHIEMLANHYTGIIYLPFVLDHIAKQTLPVRTPPATPEQ